MSFLEKVKLVPIYLLYKIAMWILDLQTNFQYRKNYGDFEFKRDYKRYRIKSVPNEAGLILGGIVKYLRDIPGPVRNLLLLGENEAVKKIYRDTFKIETIATAGLYPDSDLVWNYEESLPANMGTYQVIISQAMLEHLIDPYKHFKDVSQLLEPGGYFIVHTVLPGYFYHRYPVDCLRFYPDWFEEVAQRLKWRVVARHIRRGYIFYKFQKT